MTNCKQQRRILGTEVQMNQCWAEKGRLTEDKCLIYLLIKLLHEREVTNCVHVRVR
jgi:hypothetical protein